MLFGFALIFFQTPNPWEVLNFSLALQIVGVIALYSFVFKKPVFQPFFWKIALIVFVFFLGLGVVNSINPALLSGIPTSESPSLISILLTVPIAYAMYRLAFKASK